MRDINPPQWTDLTPREIGALTRGCGPDVLPEEAVPELWFHDSCRAHDFAYWRGGSSEDRKAADRAFYAAMRDDAREGSNPFSRAWRALWAWIYYHAVRVGGAITAAQAFNGTSKTWEELYTDVETYYYLNPQNRTGDE